MPDNPDTHEVAEYEVGGSTFQLTADHAERMAADLGVNAERKAGPNDPESAYPEDTPEAAQATSDEAARLAAEDKGKSDTPKPATKVARPATKE